MIAALLLEHKIPHTILSRENPKPPVLEGWSFSVYNGAEEHASGWGSASLADMAPALLAAVGMTDAATAHKRAQAAETRAIDLAGERDAAVEALDVANDMIGKLCAVMAGAGFDGDLLTGVKRLITQRDALADGCREFASKAVDAEETIGSLRDERKDLSAVLKRWEDFVRGYLPTVTLATNTADRHFDLRVALGDDVIYALKRELSTAQGERDATKRELATAQMQLRDISRVLGPRRGEEPVWDQADRARKILDRWQDLAVKLLPACPQVSFTQAIPDLGSRHFALRVYMEGEISALRSRLSLAAEREDLTIAALGHPCSTNGIPTEVEHLASEVRRYRHCADSLAAENANLRSQAAGEIAATTQWADEAERLRGLLNDHELTKPLRVALGWAERRDLSAERVVEAAVVAVTHSVALSKEVTRLNATLENTGGYGAREAAKALRKENEALRNQVATLTAAVDGDLARSARVLAAVRTTLETPEGECLADHAAQVLRRAKALDAWQAWGCRAACVVAADDDTLRGEIDKALPMWRRGAPAT